MFNKTQITKEVNIIICHNDVFFNLWFENLIYGKCARKPAAAIYVHADIMLSVVIDNVDSLSS